MKILVIGSGGREHALCRTIAASPLCTQLYCAPGNAGIANLAEIVPIAVENQNSLCDWACKQKIDFVVIGPEIPLAAGMVDQLEASGIPTFGPNIAAAQLEGSKAFMKQVCMQAGIPTADWACFNDSETAKTYIRSQKMPIVIKADGLAAGKGVVVARNLTEAEQSIDAALVGRQFGAAGARLVIEEYLIGEEVSFFALCDGKTALPLASAQDHKTAYDDDLGPNTGGMGAFSPAPCLTEALAEQVMQTIIQPALDQMTQNGMPFTGILFAGLMLTEQGPRLLEFNVRFGDPEAQTLLLRLDCDLVPALMAAREGKLHTVNLRWKPQTALCVVLATRGYPGPYERGSVIGGLETFDPADPDLTIFHAGTAYEAGQLVAVGGRVLGVTALGKDLVVAQAQAYAAVDQIIWPGGFCRRDIGQRHIGQHPLLSSANNDRKR